MTGHALMNEKGNQSQDWPSGDPVVTAPPLLCLSPLITHISGLISPSMKVLVSVISSVLALEPRTQTLKPRFLLHLNCHDQGHETYANYVYIFPGLTLHNMTPAVSYQSLPGLPHWLSLRL